VLVVAINAGSGAPLNSDEKINEHLKDPAFNPTGQLFLEKKSGIGPTGVLARTDLHIDFNAQKAKRVQTF
jgi:hypothetical protein